MRRDRPDTTELLLASALMMAGDDSNAVIGLLLSATVNACLLAEHPRGARDTTKEAAMASLA